MLPLPLLQLWNGSINSAHLLTFHKDRTKRHIITVLLISEVYPLKSKCQAFVSMILIHKYYVGLSYIEHLLHTVLTWHSTVLTEMHAHGNCIFAHHGSVSWGHHMQSKGCMPGIALHSSFLLLTMFTPPFHTVLIIFTFWGRTYSVSYWVLEWPEIQTPIWRALKTTCFPWTCVWCFLEEWSSIIKYICF